MLNKIKKTEIPSIPNEKLCKYNGIIVFKPILPIQRNLYDPFILSKKLKNLKIIKKLRLKLIEYTSHTYKK